MSQTEAHINLLQLTNGVEVTIRRGPQLCKLIAVPAASKTNLVGKDGSFTTITIADWLILVSEFTLEPRQPQKGDEYSIGSDKYLCGHPDSKQPAFRNFNQLDRPAVAWRVHSIPR